MAIQIYPEKPEKFSKLQPPRLYWYLLNEASPIKHVLQSVVLVVVDIYVANVSNIGQECTQH